MSELETAVAISAPGLTDEQAERVGVLLADLAYSYWRKHMAPTVAADAQPAQEKAQRL